RVPVAQLAEAGSLTAPSFRVPVPSGAPTEVIRRPSPVEAPRWRSSHLMDRSLALVAAGAASAAPTNQVTRGYDTTLGRRDMTDPRFCGIHVAGGRQRGVVPVSHE